MQTKTTMRYHLTPVRMAIIKKPFYYHNGYYHLTPVRMAIIKHQKQMLERIWRTVLLVRLNWYSYYGKQHGDCSKKLRTEVPYDPAIPFLGIYLKDTNFERYMPHYVHCSIIYSSQLKCPLMDEWRKKMWYTHARTRTHTQNGILLSHKNK